MSKGKRQGRDRRSRGDAPLKASRRRLVVVLAIALAVGGAVLVAVLLPPEKRPRQDASVATPPSPSKTPTRAIAKAAAGFGALKGRWYRPDGGYVIEIREVSADGRMNATYSNPNPIRVSKAEARREGGLMKVFIELRDTGYPGCTYNLVYDRERDSLKGVYYQAAMQQSFDIFFIRLR